jgi:hypothetical protein
VLTNVKSQTQGIKIKIIVSGIECEEKRDTKILQLSIITQTRSNTRFTEHTNMMIFVLFIE